MPETITAKELKNHTGEVLQRVRGGATVIITNRGRPVAVMAPPDSLRQGEVQDARSLQAIWQDITATLAATEPAEPTWQAAMSAARSRP